MFGSPENSESNGGEISALARRCADAEQALSDADDRLQMFIKAIPCGVHEYLCNEYGALVLAGGNRHADRLLGFEHARFIDKPLEILLPHFNDAELMQVCMDIAKDGGVFEDTMTVDQDNGDTTSINISVIQTAAKRIAILFRCPNEKQRMAVALKRIEDKYRDLVENANSIILQMDTEGRITFFNDFAQRFFAFSAEEVLGHNVVGTIVPETETTGRDLERMIKDIIQNTRAYSNNVNQNIRRNGERVWVAWTNRPIFDEKGRLQGVLSIGNDMTERKRAEEALQLNEARLNALYEMSQLQFPDEESLIEYALLQAVKLMDSEMGYVHLLRGREAYLEYYAWSGKISKLNAGASGKPFPLARVAVQSECRSLRKPVIQNNLDPVEDKPAHPGTNAPLQRHMCVPILDGDTVIAVAGVANKQMDYDERDLRQLHIFLDGGWKIIRQKRTEQEMRRFAGELNAFFDLVPDLMAITAAGGRYRKINPAWQAILGWTEEELLARPFLDFVHPEDIPGLRATMRDLAATDRVQHCINRWRCKDGSYRWLEWLAKQDKRAGLVYSIARDITDRLLSEDGPQSMANLVEHHDNLIAIANPEGGLLFLNAAGRRMLRVDHSESLARYSVADILPEEIEALFQNRNLLETLKKGPFYIESRLRLAGAEAAMDVELNLFLLPSAQPGVTRNVVLMMRDISERMNAKAAMLSIMLDTLAKTDTPFFDSAAGALANLLSCDAALLGVPCGQDKLKCLSITIDEKLAPWSYDVLEGTPVQAVLQSGFHHYPRNLRSLFPEDPAITEAGMNSFVGIPVRDNDNRTLAVLCGFSRREMSISTDVIDMLHMLAAKAAAEIGRMGETCAPVFKQPVASS